MHVAGPLARGRFHRIHRIHHGKPGRKARQEARQIARQADRRMACLPGVKAAREGSAAGGFQPKAALNRLRNKPWNAPEQGVCSGQPVARKRLRCPGTMEHGFSREGGIYMSRGTNQKHL